MSEVVVDAITSGVAFLELLSPGRSKISHALISSDITSQASTLDNKSFRSHPEEAWKMMRRLMAIASGSKYSSDRSLPILHDERHVPVNTHSWKLEIHFEYVAKLELADHMTADQLAQRCTDVCSTSVDLTPQMSNIMGLLS